MGIVRSLRAVLPAALERRVPCSCQEQTQNRMNHAPMQLAFGSVANRGRRTVFLHDYAPAATAGAPPVMWLRQDERCAAHERALCQSCRNCHAALPSGGFPPIAHCSRCLRQPYDGYFPGESTPGPRAVYTLARMAIGTHSRRESGPLLRPDSRGVCHEPFCLAFCRS